MFHFLFLLWSQADNLSHLQTVTFSVTISNHLTLERGKGLLPWLLIGAVINIFHLKERRERIHSSITTGMKKEFAHFDLQRNVLSAGLTAEMGE